MSQPTVNADLADHNLIKNRSEPDHSIEVSEKDIIGAAKEIRAGKQAEKKDARVKRE